MKTVSSLFLEPDFLLVISLPDAFKTRMTELMAFYLHKKAVIERCPDSEPSVFGHY